MISASPVYFASPNASLLALLDRLYAAHGNKLMYKPSACTVSARWAGTTSAPASMYLELIPGRIPAQEKGLFILAAEQGE